MLHFFELFGVAVGAISGVLAAAGKRIDLFGVIVLALVTALGGGTVRDIMLGGAATPVFWIKTPEYVVTAALTALAMFFIAHRWTMPGAVLMIADAVVLAMFTLLGAAKGLEFNAAGVNAVVLGVITGVAGGILRDVLLGEIPLVFRKETLLYATAAFFGAAVFVILEHCWPGNTTGRLLSISATLAARLAAVRWNISLPVFKS